MEPKKIEIWVVLDAEGDYAVGVDRDQAVERFEEEIGGTAGARLAKITVTMTPPVEVEANVSIPDGAGETLTAAAE
jgi:hypothetical protein